MANTQTPAESAAEYLTNLAVLKPTTDVQSQDTDWFIRSQVIGGLVSGLYEDLQLLENDIFPQSSRHDAIGKHLATYFPAPNNTFLPATPAQGPVLVSGSIGTTFGTGTIFSYPQNGNQYQPITPVTLSAATGIVEVQSTANGGNQNLLVGTALTITNPPVGANPSAVVFGSPIAGGTDSESDTAAINRLLARLQSPPAGGTAADYKNYALAVPGVTDANVIRFIYGLGTVGVTITSGTTDIDSAINNGNPIIRQPSQELINQVLDALIAQVPETDCAYVLPPAEVSIPVTVQVAYSQGDGSTIPSGQTLTQDQLVAREVMRAIYKTPPGGRIINGTGFVVAADIEDSIESNLGNSPYVAGAIAQIVSDQRVEDLSASGVNVGILAFQIAIPGAITLESI